MDDPINNDSKTQNKIQDILKILIYLYYYEETILKDKKGINFNGKEKYYLIKSKWIKELKEYYEYQKISKSLDEFRLEKEDGSSIPINFGDLKNNIVLYRIKLHLNYCNINLLSKQPNENLNDSNINILPNKNKANFIYYSNGYIINSLILEIFENLMFGGQKIKIKPINIFNKENNIFLPLIGKTFTFVTIGNLNNELIFNGNSCLCYYNLKTFEIEKYILLNTSFKDYIISRNCQENDLNIQNLKKEINKQTNIIGKFARINLVLLNSNKSTEIRATSSKIEINKLLPKRKDNYIYNNNSALNKSEQAIHKIMTFNDLNGRNQTPQNIIKSQVNLINNNIQHNSTVLFKIQEESINVPRNTNPKLQNKVNITKDNNQNEQVKLLQNELKKSNQKINNLIKEISKNKQIIEQISGEKKKLIEKDKKNQEQIKILIGSSNKREKEKDEKNKNILNEKEVKINELEKEVSRLKNLLNNQTETENKIENLNNECNKLKNENLEKDNQIKMLKIEINNKSKDKENELTNKINENIELQRNNEELKKELSNNKKLQNDLIKESKQKDEQLQKLKNENQINMEEKEKEIKNVKQILDNLQKDNENLKKIEKELKEKINSKIDDLIKKDDEINDLNQKYQSIQKELENEKNVNNELKEKENEENKIYQLQNQLNEKEKIINSLNQENINLKSQINNENQKKSYFEKEYQTNKKELNEKEKEINNKISILEDNENNLKIENIDIIDNIKQNEKNINLINENNMLENQLIQKEEHLNQSIENANVANNCLLNSIEINQIKNYIDKSRQNLYQSQNQNQNSQLIIPDPSPSKEIENIEIYQEPTLIGLNNIGAACFMNSILQCLSQTKSLTNYFLKNSNFQIIMNNNIAKQDKNLPQLSPVYLKLIKMLWDKNKKGTSFSPNEFMETVEKINPLFKNGQTGDYKDFIIFILEQIHKELKRPVNSQNQLIVQPLNQYDRNNAFANFKNDFQKECSVVSDIFFGFIETTNICLFCKNVYGSQGINYPICYNYGIFNCLIFPLEEVKNDINNNANSNIQINQNNIVTLNDCFRYNQKTNTFTGENKNYCNNCKQLFDSEYTNRIYSSPNVLILILNRGKDNKYNIKLDFTETFDLTQFVVVKDRSPLIYNLNGVITHYGQSGPNAHFIGFCKSPINNKWYKYNDAFVNLVEDVQKEIINFGTPYILFYQKSN